MARRFFGLFALIVLSLGMVTQSAFASATEQAQFAVPILVVNTSFLNVRSGDGPQYTIVATVVGGMELPVLGTNGDNSWYLVTTPVGAGWVDVSFTLARGDFRNVPLIEVEPVMTSSLPTPLTIGLPQYVSNPIIASAQNWLTATAQGSLNVLTVNLLTQPNDAAPIITLLFRDTNVEYPVLGYAHDDRGVLWASIFVPGAGTGWIGADKLDISSGAVSGISGGASSVAPVPVIGSAHIVVNTSYQNIRSGPGGNFGVIATVPGGTTFYPVGVMKDASWYLVRGDFGQGWISSEFVLFRGVFSSVPVIQSAY